MDGTTNQRVRGTPSEVEDVEPASVEHSDRPLRLLDGATSDWGGALKLSDSALANESRRHE